MKENIKFAENYILGIMHDNNAIDYCGYLIDKKHIERYLIDANRRFKLVCDYIEKNVSPPASCLEVGTAYGSISIALAKAGFKMYSTDMKENIECYCKPLLAYNIPVKSWNLHSNELPWPPASFDLIIASEVLEHLYISYRSAVLKMAWMLKPGGVLLITVPNLYRFPNIVRIFRGINICEPFKDEAGYENGVFFDHRGHPREPVMGEMVEAFRTAGLEKIIASFENFVHYEGAKGIIMHLVPKCMRDGIVVLGRKA